MKKKALEACGVVGVLRLFNKSVIEFDLIGTVRVGSKNGSWIVSRSALPSSFDFLSTRKCGMKGLGFWRSSEVSLGLSLLKASVIKFNFIGSVVFIVPGDYSGIIGGSILPPPFDSFSNSKRGFCLSLDESDEMNDRKLVTSMGGEIFYLGEMFYP